MTFRKDQLVIFQQRIISVFMAGIFSLLILLFWDSNFLLCIVGALLVSLCIGLFFAAPAMYREMITISEAGITCQKYGKQLWSYGWEQIAELRKTNRFNMPSVEIILFDQSENPEPYGAADRYFQLGKEAKTAVRQYWCYR